MIQPIVEGLGYECWGIEYLSQGKHTTLRVFIESLDAAKVQVEDPLQSENAGIDEKGAVEEDKVSESGVGLKDCELVSRQLSGVLDVEDPISGDYSLEVSSPGMDRSLYKLSHYKRFEGSQVALKLRMPYEGRRKYNGLLNGVEGNDIIVQVEQEEFLFPIEAIEKANIIPQFD